MARRLRLDYYQALDHAHCSGDLELFIKLVADSVIESFKTYFWVLGMTGEAGELLEQGGDALS